MEKHWPEGFYFGAATSAHQVDGENKNDWTMWEKANASRLAAKAKRNPPAGGWPDYILKNYPNPLQEENYISNHACDHYNRYEEDFDLAKELGHNAHRFSIEWSRIEPEENIFNTDATKHYQNVVRALRERNMEPFVTLWHWTIPVWLRDKGGILNKNFPAYFARYAEYVVRNIGNDVTYWMTLNEPTSVVVNGYLRGIWPPQRKGLLAAHAAYKQLAATHRAGFAAIKKVNPRAQVGLGNILVAYKPHHTYSPLDRLAVRIRDYWTNTHFLKLTGDTHDYLTLHFYFRFVIGFPQRIIPVQEETTDMGWGIHQEEILTFLKRLALYRKPIFVTENGLADARDVRRTNFIREGLGGIREAIKSNINVRGYFYWSLLDNFEWDKGFWPRFGLIEVDYRRLTRKIRPSALAYKAMIENGLET